MKTLIAQPLTKAAFEPFGQVLTTKGAHHYPINAGMTERFHDLAKIDFLVVDRGGEGDNLQEHFFDTPYRVVLKD